MLAVGLASLVALTIAASGASAATGSPNLASTSRSAQVSPVQAAVANSVQRWSAQFVAAYQGERPIKWTPLAAGVTQHGLQVVGIALTARSPGGTWGLEDLLKRRGPDGPLLPASSDSISVHRMASNGQDSYFAQVSAAADSVRNHAWAIEIEDRDTARCGAENQVSELPWCSQGPIMTTRPSPGPGEKPLSLTQWRLVEGQIQAEINTGLQRSAIRGPVLPNLPQQFFSSEGTAARLAVAASSGSAASIYRGCDAAQWGTSPCWNPANPADVAAMHPCPNWTNRHTQAFDPDEGSYQGFVKIRSTVSCKLAYKLMNDRAEGGPEGFDPAAGWYWWSGYGNVGGVWHRGVEDLIRGLHIARTNEAIPAPLNWNASSAMLEHDLITYDQEELIDCSTIPNKANEHCVNITPASYAGVRL